MQTTTTGAGVSLIQDTLISARRGGAMQVVEAGAEILLY